MTRNRDRNRRQGFYQRLFLSSEYDLKSKTDFEVNVKLNKKAGQRNPALIIPYNLLKEFIGEEQPPQVIPADPYQYS